MDDELDVEVDDDELTALALAADPDQLVGPDAVPIVISNSGMSGLLPDWYMPAPIARVGGRTPRVTLGVIGLALIVINAAGLCVTYGVPEVAW